MYSSAFEQTIGNLLEAAGMAVTATPSDRTKVDFIFRDPADQRIAIEVKGYTYRSQGKQLEQIAKALESIADHIDKFILVTPFKPTATNLEKFLKATHGLARVEWLSVQEFAEYLGLKDLNLESPEVAAALQEVASQTYLRSINEWAAHNYWLKRDPTNPSLWFHHLQVEDAVDRQLSPTMVRRLRGHKGPPEQFLKIGERTHVVVVLSDIQNFSLLVKAVKPDDLNDAMSKYYRLARELVWAHGGTLDKFIGDAVLAIFSYPESQVDAHVNAIKFAADLIEMGKPILEGLKNLINESIDTGTRVGVSMGELSILNIGLRSIELSFVGDVINLTSRLEHESDLNGCLIDNLTKVALVKSDSDFVQKLSLAGKTLDKEKVKGQLTAIQAWQISPEVVPLLSDLDKNLSMENDEFGESTR